MFAHIDWHSVKLTLASTGLALITGNGVLMVLTIISIVTTIVYNAIKIYKELKK
jgi:hypothetical protein